MGDEHQAKRDAQAEGAIRGETIVDHGKSPETGPVGLGSEDWSALFANQIVDWR